MASPAQPNAHRPRAPQSDDVLRHIFLFLDSPADLARACAASPTFRRIITDRRFLRRFQALHPPPLVGIVGRSVFLPAEPPHPSAAAAKAFVDGVDSVELHCSFLLPSPGPWHCLDTRDGRDLFYADHAESRVNSHYLLARRLAVCDPLHGRYRVLPAIPEDLAALVGHKEDVYGCKHFLAPPAEDAEEKDDPFLNHPPGQDDDDDDCSSSSPFRVMSLMQCAARLVLFIFSFSGAGAEGGKWHAVTFDDSWSYVCSCNGGRPWLLRRRYYVHGRFCWLIMPSEKNLLVLDARRTMPELSTVNLPSYVRCLAASDKAAFVEATGEQDRIGVFTIHKHGEHDVYHLLYAVQRDDGGDRWEPEAIIYLPLHYHDYRVIGLAGGYLLLEAFSEGWHGFKIKTRDCACFSLHLQTLQLHWFCGKRNSFVDDRPYAGFPPYLSPPTV